MSERSKFRPRWERASTRSSASEPMSWRTTPASAEPRWASTQREGEWPWSEMDYFPRPTPRSPPADRSGDQGLRSDFDRYATRASRRRDDRRDPYLFEDAGWKNDRPGQRSTMTQHDGERQVHAHCQQQYARDAHKLNHRSTWSGIESSRPFPPLNAPRILPRLPSLSERYSLSSTSSTTRLSSTSSNTPSPPPSDAIRASSPLYVRTQTNGLLSSPYLFGRPGSPPQSQTRAPTAVSRDVEDLRATQRRRPPVSADFPPATPRERIVMDGRSKPKRRKTRVCTTSGCDKLVVNRGVCIRHGGGKRCSVDDCDCRAQNKGLCWKHGGYTICQVDGCGKRAKSRGMCWSHGGGTRCKTDGCEKIAVSRGCCWAHGGGKRCKLDGCHKPAALRMDNLCAEHFVGSRANRELRAQIQAPRARYDELRPW